MNHDQIRKTFVAITPDQLANKPSLLRLRDPGLLLLFGAASHRYTLNACLSREELQRFEVLVGVTLPDKYRDFLLRFGNGDAGPGFRISIGWIEPPHKFREVLRDGKLWFADCPCILAATNDSANSQLSRTSGEWFAPFAVTQGSSKSKDVRWP